MGDDHHLSDTLSLRFRQAGSRLELSKLSDDEEDDTEIADVDLTLIGGAAADNDDSDFDDDFKVIKQSQPDLLLMKTLWSFSVGALKLARILKSYTFQSMI